MRPVAASHEVKSNHYAPVTKKMCTFLARLPESESPEMPAATQTRQRKSCDSEARSAEMLSQSAARASIAPDACQPASTDGRQSASPQTPQNGNTIPLSSAAGISVASADSHPSPPAGPTRWPAHRAPPQL